MDLDILTRMTASSRVLPTASDAVLSGLRVCNVGTRRVDAPDRQDLDRPAQDQHGLTLVVHGEAVFLKPAPIRQIRADDYILLPAGIPYQYRSIDRRGWRAVWIRFTCPPGTLEGLDLQVGPRPAGRAVRHAFGALLGLAGVAGTPGPLLAAGLALLLAELSVATRSRRPSDDGVDAALAEIRLQPGRSWLFPELARRHRLSYSALRQGLRRRTGLAPHRLLRQLRLQAVAQALALGASVGEAAALGGFPDPFHCSRLFRRAYGCAPSRWRDDQQV